MQNELFSCSVTAVIEEAPVSITAINYAELHNGWTMDASNKRKETLSAEIEFDTGVAIRRCHIEKVVDFQYARRWKDLEIFLLKLP